MKPRLEYASPEDRYWLGTDDASGRHFAEDSQAVTRTFMFAG